MKKLQIRAFDTKSKMDVEIIKMDFDKQRCTYVPVGINLKIVDILKPMPISNLKNIYVLIDGEVVYRRTE